MRVKWQRVIDVPESYMDTYDGTVSPVVNYAGEVLGCVRAFGETRLVVILDSGECVQVEIGQVRRDRGGIEGGEKG